MTTRSLATLIAALLAATLLAGCSGDDPEPQFADPTSDSPSTDGPTSTPTQAVEDPQVAAISAFFEGVTDSLATGDPQSFTSKAADSCANCKVLESNLDQAYADGGYIKGAAYRIIEISQSTNGGTDIWDVRIETARERWYDGMDKLVKVITPGVQSFQVQLEGRDGEFLVKELKLR